MSQPRNTERVRSQLATRGQERGQVSEFGQVNGFIEAMRPQLARALPKHLNPDRLARIALTEVRRTPLLAKCTQESFGGALMNCAQLGLEPGPLGEAYLIPFRNNKTKTYEVTLIVGYQGMIKLFWQSPIAKALDAQVVYENDHFEYEFGLQPKLIHRPQLSDRGKAIAYYAVASTTSGGSGFVVLSPEDIERIRTRSRAKDDGPWKTDYDAMAKKTCIRQLFKFMPKSSELANALAADETVRRDVDAEVDAMAGMQVGGDVIDADLDDPAPEPDRAEAAQTAESEGVDIANDPVLPDDAS